MSTKGDDAQEIPPAADGVCRGQPNPWALLFPLVSGSELGSNLGVGVVIKQIALSFSIMAMPG